MAERPAADSLGGGDAPDASSDANASGGSGRERLRSLQWLAGGALVGLALAFTGLLDSNPRNLPDEVVARVNGMDILDSDYQRYLSLLAMDRRNPLDDEARRHVLDRMIEEKLLLQRGVDLGLIESDPRVRKAITGAMISSVVSDITAASPSERELRAFFAEHRDYFALPERIHLRRLVFRPRQPGEDLMARARLARQELLAGEEFATVQDRHGDKDILAPPDGLLPPHKLQEYVGPEQLKRVRAMGEGMVSEPLVGTEGLVLLIKAGHQPRQDVRFEDVLEQVVTEYKRRAGDEALRAYLDQLRESADLLLSKRLPSAQ